MSLDTTSIRRDTRVALPSSDDYLFRLGVALFGFASVNSFMTEIAAALNPLVSRTKLLDSGPGEVVTAFLSAVQLWRGPDISEPTKRAVEEFKRLNEQRTDFVHAYPITNASGDQILHRRKDAKGKYFEVTESFLAEFTSRLTQVTDALYEIRAIVRPEL